jgi:hypothetical protein
MVDKNALDINVTGLNARVYKLIVLKLFKSRTRTFKLNERQLFSLLFLVSPALYTLFFVPKMVDSYLLQLLLMIHFKRE